MEDHGRLPNWFHHPAAYWAWHVGLFLVITSAVYSSSCSEQSGSSNAIDVPTVDARQLLPVRERSQRKIAVIFVHGFNGDRDSTWINTLSGASWPTLLCEDSSLDPIDIYSFGYETSLTGPNQTIDQIAESLQLHIETHVAGRELAFVSHSMGGIVVRKALLTHRDTASRTKVLYFAGTPTDGSAMAVLIRPFTANRHLNELANDGVQWLDKRQNEWLNSGLSAIPSYGTSETKRSAPILDVVDQDSARALINKNFTPLPYSHEDLVNPANLEDARHLTLRRASVCRSEDL